MASEKTYVIQYTSDKLYFGEPFREIERAEALRLFFIEIESELQHKVSPNRVSEMGEVHLMLLHEEKQAIAIVILDMQGDKS